MFCKTQSSERHLRDWRNLRQTARSMQEILHCFSQVPVKNRFIDYYTPENWPNPFDIIQDQMYDVSAISLLIYHTAVNLGFIDFNQVTWHVISNHDSGQEGLVFEHQDHVYNFQPHMVVSTEYAWKNSTRFITHHCVIIKPI